MKSNARWIVALAVITGACLNEAVRSTAATSKEVAEATEMMSGADAQERAAAAARERDPAWKPSCAEVGLIQIGDRKRPGALKNFCLNGEGNILACFAPGIRVYSPNGELLKTLPLDIKPSAICVAKDGSIFVAGDGRVLKLEATGKVLASRRVATVRAAGYRLHRYGTVSYRNIFPAARCDLRHIRPRACGCLR